MRATKVIQEIKHLSYIHGLKYLNLPTLLYQRLRGEMIMVHKLLSGIYDASNAFQLVKPNSFVTRGHYLRLFKRHVLYDLCKNYFGNRITSIWNSLPDNVINAYSIGEFEKNLDSFWSNQACFYIIKPT